MRTFFYAMVLGCSTVMAASEAPAGPVTILCLGDSLTEGYGLMRTQAYPALVEKGLIDRGYDVQVINAGISGSTSASAPSRLKWHLKSKPDILVLALGANDALRGLAPEQAQESLDQTIDLAQKNNIRVLLVGMKAPPNYGGSYARRFEQIYTSLAKKYKVPLLPFLLEGVAGDKTLNLADGLHPNAEGHRRMATLIEQALTPFLSAREKAS